MMMDDDADRDSIIQLSKSAHLAMEAACDAVRQGGSHLDAEIAAYKVLSASLQRLETASVPSAALTGDDSVISSVTDGTSLAKIQATTFAAMAMNQTNNHEQGEKSYRTRKATSALDIVGSALPSVIETSSKHSSTHFSSLPPLEVSSTCEFFALVRFQSIAKHHKYVG